MGGGVCISCEFARKGESYLTSFEGMSYYTTLNIIFGGGGERRCFMTDDPGGGLFQLYIFMGRGCVKIAPSGDCRRRSFQLMRKRRGEKREWTGKIFLYFLMGGKGRKREMIPSSGMGEKQFLFAKTGRARIATLDFWKGGEGGDDPASDDGMKRGGREVI